MACEDATDLGNIDIFGFSEQEADAVVVTSFIADGTFSPPTDTTVSATVGSPDNTWRQLNNVRLNAREDHQIFIPGANRTYRISEVRFGQKECNQCLFTQDYYNGIISLKIGGVETSSGIDLVR
jgi:hypothetical protein